MTNVFRFIALVVFMAGIPMYVVLAQVPPPTPAVPIPSVFALSSMYPSGAVPLTASSGNVANGSTAATLTGAAGKITYLTGFEYTSGGASVGICGNPTITGTLGGTLTYAFCTVAGVLLLNPPVVISYNPPIPASAANTPIVVTFPALGLGNTQSAVVAHGFQL